MITWLTCGDKDNVFVGVPKTDASPSRERGLQKGIIPTRPLHILTRLEASKV